MRRLIRLLNRAIDPLTGGDHTWDGFMSMVIAFVLIVGFGVVVLGLAR